MKKNYCRNPDGEPTIWCYTTDRKKRWEYCSPRSSLLETNGTDTEVASSTDPEFETLGEDASAFWQTKVSVAADSGYENFAGIATGVNVTSANRVCGKAGVNVHAGGRVTALNFPSELAFDTRVLKDWILGEVKALPFKLPKAIAKLVDKCVGIPGLDLSSLTKKLEGTFAHVADEIAKAIPDVKIDLGIKPEELFRSGKACANVWQDTLPKGQTCGDHNVGC